MSEERGAVWRGKSEETRSGVYKLRAGKFSEGKGERRLRGERP